tara:strand:- start:536 stop:3028 length:2493 start_codon:yes stop_codon:yes gene_type:complete
MSKADNKKLAIKKIKEYFPGINKQGINAIMANIQIETSFSGGNLIEGKFGWDTIRDNRKGGPGGGNWITINKKLNEWAKSKGYVNANGDVDEAKAKAAYEKLNKAEANAVKYYGNEDELAGGFGALQITAADSLPGRKGQILDISKELGYSQEKLVEELNNGNFELGLDLALTFYRDENDGNPWTVESLNKTSPYDLRYNKKGGINPGEGKGEGGPDDKDGRKLPDHVANAFQEYGSVSANKNNNPTFDKKWKQDLFEKVKETINLNEATDSPLSNEDLTIFSDQIDGMTYEEAKNEFGIVTDDKGGFSINVGPETLKSQLNLQNTEIKTAAVKQRLQAVINDSNSSAEEIEAAKQNIIDLDENLEALKNSLDNVILDHIIPLDHPMYTNDPGYQGKTAELGFVTGRSSDLVDELNRQLDERYGEQTEDKDGNIVNVIGEDRVREGEVDLNEEAETFVGPDGKEYEYVKVDAGDKDEITTSGLLDSDQGSELVKPQSAMSFEEWKERFPDGTREDYDAIINKANENLEKVKGKTYFDLRGEGAFEESFLDKMGGLSSLIGLATGAIGLGAALKDVDIPKDPKLGPAFQQRLEESKRMAQQGLTPSELAKAHNDLDSSYATGIDNIVRGSAGNRAQFLAGLGGLDVARQSALMDIAVADAQMQRQNQEKYDSMMLMNEQYEAARQAKYQDAKFQQDTARQAAGAALAGSSISMVADAVASRQTNRYHKMKTEQLLMQMGYKATKEGKSGQDKVGDGVQTSFSIFDNEGPDFNLLDADDQAVNTDVSNQPKNKNTGNNLLNTSPLNTSSGLINTDSEIDLGTQMYDIFNTGQ